MNCEWVREHLSAYVDGVLSEVERVRVDQHLARCSGCAAEEQVLRAAVAALRRAAHEVEVPPGFRARVMARVAKLPAPAARRPAAPAWRRWGLPAAAAAAAAALITLQVQSQSGWQAPPLGPQPPGFAQSGGGTGQGAPVAAGGIAPAPGGGGASTGVAGAGIGTGEPGAGGAGVQGGPGPMASPGGGAPPGGPGAGGDPAGGATVGTGAGLATGGAAPAGPGAGGQGLGSAPAPSSGGVPAPGGSGGAPSAGAQGGAGGAPGGGGQPGRQAGSTAHTITLLDVTGAQVRTASDDEILRIGQPPAGVRYEQAVYRVFRRVPSLAAEQQVAQVALAHQGQVIRRTAREGVVEVWLQVPRIQAGAVLGDLDRVGVEAEPVAAARRDLTAQVQDTLRRLQGTIRNLEALQQAAARPDASPVERETARQGVAELQAQRQTLAAELAALRDQLDTVEVHVVLEQAGGTSVAPGGATTGPSGAAPAAGGAPALPTGG